jgi:hypothetical protein
MDVVGEGLHGGELVVSVEDALRVALAFPCVVDVDVDVSGVAHAAGDKCVGGCADICIGDTTGEVIPAVPAHGWSGGEGGILGESRGSKSKSDECGYTEL